MAETAHDLILHDLCKTFASATGPLEILRHVEFGVNRGQAVAITGPSGSGKSTLLYIVGTLDEPTSGKVTLMGDDPFARNDADRARYRNERIGFVFQDHHLLPQFNVLENVLLPMIAAGGVDDKAESRAKQLLERVGLSSRLTHRPAQLSGGERQRVGICRALINQPALLLADEPTGNLDPKSAEEVGTLLLEVAAEQNTLLLCATHSLELAHRFGLQKHLRDGTLKDA